MTEAKREAHFEKYSVPGITDDIMIKIVGGYCEPVTREEDIVDPFNQKGSFSPQ